ncbi:hypothetical protein B0H14DRAFT_1389879 [Mycena olivaceomarginata]|nr:hypothetical protein B0H14DRAFT_1389879 [Mycena olivaceomarginata]
MPAKALKFKTYRIPEGRHCLIIQNPWPFDESVSNARKPQAYINAVVGWISIMIQDLCSVDIHHNDIQIFYQSTHRHLIVEIQSTALGSVDVLLGAHHSSAFLTAQYAGLGNLTSVIYEYNYMRFNSPEKTNWTNHTASYSSLPPEFPVKREDIGYSYPTPLPTDSPKHALAKPLPGRLIVGHPDSIQQTPAPAADPPPPANQSGGLAVDPHEGSSNTVIREQMTPLSERSPPPPPEANPPSEFAFTPYERPLNFPGRQTATNPSSSAPQQPEPAHTKRDPYEEEADALERLRDTTEIPVAAASTPHIKSETVKTEEYRPSVKMEEMFPDVNAAMRARAAETIYGGRNKEEGLGGVRVKTEEDWPIKAEYIPTSELVDILAQGRQALRERERRGVKREETDESEIKAEHSTLGVKPEPGDVPMPRARPANKRFDPFDGYEPELNSRQTPSVRGYSASTTYSRPPPARVKQEEESMSRPHAPSVKQDDRSGRGGRESHTYSPGVKREYDDGGYSPGRSFI